MKPRSKPRPEVRLIGNTIKKCVSEGLDIQQSMEKFLRVLAAKKKDMYQVDYNAEIPAFRRWLTKCLPMPKGVSREVDTLLFRIVDIPVIVFAIKISGFKRPLDREVGSFRLDRTAFKPKIFAQMATICGMEDDHPDKFVFRYSTIAYVTFLMKAIESTVPPNSTGDVLVATECDEGPAIIIGDIDKSGFRVNIRQNAEHAMYGYTPEL